MSRTIQQSILNLGETTVTLPGSAVVLDVQNVQETMTLFAIVDPDDTTTQTRTYETFVNEQVLADDPGDFVATVQWAGGNSIYHVYDTTRLQ